MEDATITNKQEGKRESQEEHPLYQQGKYPSIIDTDDLVFEMGRQMIGNLNKEKLLDSLLKKSTAIEKEMVKARKEKLEAENKVKEFEISNKNYVINNKKLDGEIVKLRLEVEALNKEHQETVIKLKEKIEYFKKKF